jgi:hypothetical protein
MSDEQTIDPKTLARWRTCTGKRRWNNEGQVTRRAAELGMSAYRCRFCAFWHMGHR